MNHCYVVVRSRNTLEKLNEYPDDGVYLGVIASFIVDPDLEKLAMSCVVLTFG
jgi:hypothetical protein